MSRSSILPRGPTIGERSGRSARPADLRDPYAMSENCFLVASRQGIFVMDGEGKTELVYQLPRAEGHLQCHEPRPLQARPRERVTPPRVDLAQATGRLFLADITTAATWLACGRGEIKKLLVLEQLPMPVHFSGGMESISLGGTFTLARVLGTVPVEADGSAFFEVPAMRSLFLVALDENDLSVQTDAEFRHGPAGRNQRLCGLPRTADADVSAGQRGPPCWPTNTASPCPSRRSTAWPRRRTIRETSSRSWTATASAATIPTVTTAVST